MTELQTPPAQVRPASRCSSLVARRRSGERGFTLIELIIVVTIIGILAGLAIVNVRFAQRKAREAALMDNLSTLRKAIDNFYADKQHYPADLNALVRELHPQHPQGSDHQTGGLGAGHGRSALLVPQRRRR